MIVSDSKTNRLMFVAGGSALATMALTQSVQAQTTTVDSTTVGTQLTAIQTGITGLGGTLLAMGAGILLFLIGKKIIKKLTSG